MYYAHPWVSFGALGCTSFSWRAASSARRCRHSWTPCRRAHVRGATENTTTELDGHNTGGPGTGARGKSRPTPRSAIHLTRSSPLHSNTKNVQYSATRYRKNKERDCVKSGYWVDLVTCRTTMLRCKLQRWCGAFYRRIARCSNILHEVDGSSTSCCFVAATCSAVVITRSTIGGCNATLLHSKLQENYVARITTIMVKSFTSWLH